MERINQKCMMIMRGVMIGILLVFSACQEWGAWDEPSGNQKIPPKPDYTPKIVGEYTFEEGLTGIPFLYENGLEPEILTDYDRDGVVIRLNGSYLKFDNPLTNVTLANGASVTFWVKLKNDDVNGALFSFADNEGNVLYFNGNSGLYYKNGADYLWVHNPEEVITGEFLPDEWYFVAVALGKTDFTLYINGEKKFNLSENKGIDASSNPFDLGKIVSFLNSASYFYLGYGAFENTKEAYYDDVKIFANTITAKEATPDGPNISLPEPIYFNSFDEAHTAKIIGGGGFVSSGLPEFGSVFQNVTGGSRQNYLLLPEDVLSYSAESRALSIGVWVNASKAGVSADYMWSPLFTAYGGAPVNNENTFPMFALQYRGELQVNCAGWCDFTPAQNVVGVNTLYHGVSDWLADGQWHYYTVTLTETSAKIYFDGELKNEWLVDGVSDGSVISGLFRNGAELRYICLGGNQAWNWADPDPGFMFDDIAIYNVELSARAIALIIEQK